MIKPVDDGITPEVHCIQMNDALGVAPQHQNRRQIYCAAMTILQSGGQHFSFDELSSGYTYMANFRSIHNRERTL